MLKTYPFSKQNIIFLKIPFFSQLLSIGTIFIRKVGSFSVSENNILKFIRATPNIVFYCKNHRGIKLITQVRVGRSHLHWHKSKHCFQDTLNPTCSSGFYVLHCPMYNNERHDLLSTIKNIDCRLLDVTETVLIKSFYLKTVDSHRKTKIFDATIEYILTTKRFYESLLNKKIQ